MESFAVFLLFYFCLMFEATLFAVLASTSTFLISAKSFSEIFARDYGFPPS